VRTLAYIVGVALTAGFTIAAIASMVVPRATRSGLAHLVAKSVLSVMRLPLRAMHSYKTQDRWLRIAAPISVLIQLAIYVFLIIVGMAFVIFGQTHLSWKQAAWQSASTVTTLGSVESVNGPSAITASIGAFLGLVVIAVFMGYLVGLYSAYVARESLMARFSQIGGEPAWGPMVLARSSALSGNPASLLEFEIWQTWMADVRLGQQASPVLAHFRSPDSLRHWVTTLLAMLDATSLALGLGIVEDRAAAIRVLAEGTITLRVLHRKGVSQERLNWKFEKYVLDVLDGSKTPSPPGPTFVSDDDWNTAVGVLVGMGAADRTSIESARTTFDSLRALYASDACELASRLHAVRGPWSGERLFNHPVVWPDELGEISA